MCPETEALFSRNHLDGKNNGQIDSSEHFLRHVFYLLFTIWSVWFKLTSN